MMVGGRTGNDGLHGATVSSGGMTEHTDSGDFTHVQIGLPYIEQMMMRAGLELRDKGCVRARNDFGALGIVSAFGEMGKNTDGVGGFICNLALVKLKCAGLSNWQIAISESQERFAHVIKPEKLKLAMKIYKKYGLEATPIGMFSNSGLFQMFFDRDQVFSSEMRLSGEVCFDVPYSFFDECPLDKVEVQTPKPKTVQIDYPVIDRENVMEMGLRVVSHFDVCNQAAATTRYDSTVQGITWRGPLYGQNYNIASSLAVLRPVFGRYYGATISQSYSPWQFEVDPVQAAVNAMKDVLVTQVIAGVKPTDISLADNFYTDGEDPVARWYLKEQVKVITDLSLQTKTPFMVGKDSSSGRGTFGGVTVCVLPSVCITGMGKVEDVRRLLSHQWQAPGNFLMTVGPQARCLDGSILSSSLGITGVRLDELLLDNYGRYLDMLYSLSRSGMIVSAVPINRGGIFLRLFEGVEASGLGVDTMNCSSLFPESFGSALVEVRQDAIQDLYRIYPDLQTKVVGVLQPRRGITVQMRRLNFKLLHVAWNSTFKNAPWGKENKEVMAS